MVSCFVKCPCHVTRGCWPSHWCAELMTRCCERHSVLTGNSAYKLTGRLSRPMNQSSMYLLGRHTYWEVAPTDASNASNGLVALAVDELVKVAGPATRRGICKSRETLRVTVLTPAVKRDNSFFPLGLTAVRFRLPSCRVRTV